MTDATRKRLLELDASRKESTFVYVNAANTDIRATLNRIRREQAQKQPQSLPKLRKVV
jgi:hypothetical protein